MIKKTERKAVLKGSVPTLMTDLTIIIRKLDESLQETGMDKEDSKKRIMKSFELAFKSDEEIVGEALVELLNILKGVDDNGEKYRVWCETNEIRDKVLVALEKRGVKWASGDKLTESNPFLREAPMGFIIDGGLWQTGEKDKSRFDGLEFEELKAEDLIKEVEGDE